jgi:hypothetical protein
MKLACAALLLCLPPLLAQAQTSVDGLSWLAGCWARETSARVEPGSGEQWLAPAAGAMLGMSRTIRGGKMIEYEFMRISQTAEGQLVYTAMPSGQRETSFALTSQTERELVFENPGHDFPQRIIYRLDNGGRLLARAEALRAGQLRGVDFPMRRVACELTEPRSKTIMEMRSISGEFEVKLTPQAAEVAGKAEAPGRMLLDKRYLGALEASAVGQMLAFTTAVKGSAGYVAMERVAGSLEGRRGTFVLQHSGTMERGAPTLSVSVVPDSGTDELRGLRGRMTIRIEGGKHFYDFEYRIEPTP